MLPELPKQPLILDLGCGPGMQTLDLISLTDGNIVAVDNHLEQALRQWKPLLKTSGCLAATEVAWTKANPPEPVKMFWVKEYPAIQDIEANLTAIRRAGFHPIGHFILPQSAWWDDYYTPLQARLQTLREKYQENPAALTVIDLHQQEIDLYRQYADFYGYVFYVM